MTTITRWRRFWIRLHEAYLDHCWDQQSGRVTE
jgi:hypothetical protein